MNSTHGQKHKDWLHRRKDAKKNRAMKMCGQRKKLIKALKKTAKIGTISSTSESEYEE